ncbi:MAG: AMP-binding protein, partial [Verrucomicrobiota bacterium]
WLDWLFIAACLPDDWKFVTSSATAQTSWLHRKIMLSRHTFPVETNSPYAVKRMAEFLQSGGKLVLFPEGRLSRTGSLMKLFDGTGFLLYKTEAKVVTCYLRSAARLPFSPNANRKKLFPKVTAHFSEVLIPTKPQNVSTVKARRQLTDWLRDKIVEQQFWIEMERGPKTLLAAVMETAREIPGFKILQDVTGQKLTYRKLVVGTELFAKNWHQLLGVEKRVGVLLPNVNAMPITLLSLWATGKVPAILNYSTGATIMLACAKLAELKQIITSRAFVETAKLDLKPLSDAGIEFLYVEDLRERISSGEKFFALVKTYFPGSTRVPRVSLSVAPKLQSEHISTEQLEERGFRRDAENCTRDACAPQDQTAVILFTSGSEGVPKGVELTHKNLLANLRQMLAVTDLEDSDRFFNAMPLFHSFGLSVGTLLPLVRGLFVFIYPSPLHYRMVPTIFYDLNCTVMFGTNTFLNGYARKAHAYDFRSLRYLFAAAEKLQEATANTWARQFGVRILEGYGATECSPAVAVNTLLTPSHGSAGRFLPGIEWRLESVEGVENGGRLFVRGPNVMRGYLNRDANEKFLALGGWYDTGDIVRVDENGFVFILGRLKRFAKVSGEMVSLTAVEDALAGAFPQFGLRFQIAVIAQPDEDKGEKLIAVTNEPKLQLDEIRAAIKAKGLNNLSVPREIK